MPRTRKAPREEQYAFTSVGEGVWIDGSYGDKHAIDTMARSVLPTVVRRSSDERLVNAAEELIDEWDNDELDEDDYNDWLDDATEVIQDATMPGLHWEWNGGDLILYGDDEEDE